MGAVEQAVGVLHRGHTRQAMLLGQMHKFAHAVRRLVGQANRPHLAGLDQLAQRFQLGVHGRDHAVFAWVKSHHAKQGQVARGPVQLVEVNHVGVEALQAAVASGHDVCRRQIHGPAAHPGHAARGAGHFGGDRELLAQLRVFGDPVADIGLGDLKGLGARGHGVHLGRVPKGDAALHRVAQDGVAGGLVHLFTKGHGAQANRGDVQVAGAELDGFHGGNKA